MNIVISGTVGVGKSTISHKLHKHLQSKGEDVFIMDEIMDNDPYLEAYYENRPAWTFLIQINFVMNRFKNAFSHSSRPGINIFDRHFLDDYIIGSMPFIINDMPNNLWQTYNLLNMELTNVLRESAVVDYFFLLKADFDTVIERVKGRGRESEKDVEIAYWRDMYDQYYENPNIQNYIRSSVKKLIIIDANNGDADVIVQDIMKYIESA